MKQPRTTKTGGTVETAGAKAGRRAARRTGDKPARPPSTPVQPRAAAPIPGGDLMANLWRPAIGGVADQLMGIVGAAAEYGLGRMLGGGATPRRALGKAGGFLRAAREAAGLTVAEVSSAIDLKDPALLEAAEGGRAALPVEVLLRLASVLARNDPIPFLMQVARNYSPPLWKALEQLGIGRLVLHAGREHEFINIYRSRDAARRLSDAEFAQVLEFTDAAFRMALKLVSEAKKHREADDAR